MTKREEILNKLNEMTAMCDELLEAYSRVRARYLEGTHEGAFSEFHRVGGQVLKVNCAAIELIAEHESASRAELPKWARWYWGHSRNKDIT